MSKTPVVFRVWNKGDSSDTIALFPTEPAGMNGELCSSYEHVGQHGGADYEGVISQTRPATPDEYADLRKELESEPYKYELEVYPKALKGFREIRLREAARIRNAKN